MNPVPMVDLEAQHAPLRAELEDAFRRVLASNRFILGDEVTAFEQEIAVRLGAAHAIGVSSGSDALLALLMAAGVGPGDEVVTTAYSFVATAEAVARLGARPVFADIDPQTFNLDPDAAIAKLGPKTKAVIVVHLFGRVARTRPLEERCRQLGIAVIEDAAQAIGAWRGDGTRRETAGTIGRGAALSFFPAKNLGGFGDGGMVLTGDPALRAEIRSLRNHGARDRFEHAAIGGNFRLDELQAALLRVKLPHLDRWTAERRRVAVTYRAALAGSPVEAPPDDDGCTWNQFVVRLPAERRAPVVAGLAARSIASAVYYPIPLHRQPAFTDENRTVEACPRADEAARCSLALPIHPGITDDTAKRVASAVLEVLDL